jgi:anti-sigma factor RsiW
VLCGGVDDERAHAWLDGELTASAARAFAAHLHACRGCRSHAAELAAFLDAVRRSTRRRGERAPDRLRALVRSLAVAEAPGGLPDRVAADANAG